jgi:hypothetical protein
MHLTIEVFWIGVITCNVPQGSIIGPLFFLLYINDLASVINRNNNIVLSADDTSIIVTERKKIDFGINLNQTVKDTESWFSANLLVLNFNKSHYVEFHSMHYYNTTSKIAEDQIKLPKTSETKFLGLLIDDTLAWNQHIDYVINKIARSCYALRNIKHFVPLDTLKLIYFAHIHSILSYGIIFLGGVFCVGNVFILQKKAIRIIMNSGSRKSCRYLFEKLEIIHSILNLYTH